MNMNFTLRRVNGNIVRPGETITDHNGKDWVFVGFSRGRIGPKFVVKERAGAVDTREFFASVFKGYLITEEE